MRNRAILAVLLGMAAVPALALSAEVPAEQLVLAANRTAARIAAGEGVKWRAEIDLGNAVLVVDIAQQGLNRHSRLSIRGANTGGILDIVERDGAWYVHEGGVFAKCRPNEYAFMLPTSPVFMHRGNLMLLNADSAAILGTLVSQKGDIATYSTPVQGAQRDMMETYLRELPLKVPNPTPEMQANAERMRALLKDGNQTKVDSANGIVLTFGSGRLNVSVTDFQWTPVAPSEFAVDGHPWRDLTSDITTGDMTRWAMFSNSAMVQPGMKQYDLDGRLVNLDTAEIRRIPFAGEVVQPGCFLPGRNKVVVIGVDSVMGIWSLVQIDLRTGGNRILGQTSMGTVLAQPTVSPDGKTIAVMRRSMAALIGQLCFMDVDTGRWRDVGKPLDANSPSFTSDGSAIILERIEPADPQVVAPRSVIRIDLAGNVNLVREKASAPVVLGDGRVLFNDSTDNKWKTCDSQGGDVHDYGVLPGKCGFPTVGPDGKSVLFMSFTVGQLPIPIIVKPNGVVVTPPFGPGLWAMPAWR